MNNEAPELKKLLNHFENAVHQAARDDYVDGGSYKGADRRAQAVADARRALFDYYEKGVDPPAAPTDCKPLGYAYDNPPERDRQWCITHDQPLGKCATSTAPDERDKALIEAVTEPWICVEDKPCEETTPIHWEELLAAVTGMLATVRAEVWRDAIAVIKTRLTPEDSDRNIGINDAIIALESAIYRRLDGRKIR